MTKRTLLSLVDAQEFRKLFIEELGWLNPDRPNLTITVDGKKHALTQVAGYKGLRIWHHAGLPPRPVQRSIDLEVGRESTERLLIFTGPERQDWRWPRRAQLGSANAKLVVHEHIVGLAQPDLERRLRSIAIDLDEDISVVELLQRMRDAFDTESETASVQAANLMNILYDELAAANVPPINATLALARLLFLLFGDDTAMWTTNMFGDYLETHTTAETLHVDLGNLFDVVDQPQRSRTLSATNPLTSFRYINGGLYNDALELPRLTPAFRDGLIEATKFDWGLISPAIFGAMFQTVKSKEARRAGGEHYTSEENIFKTIGPLFLDEYRSRLEVAWDDKGRLTELHNELGRLRVMDPACGCGNFLIVAYRELRALELELLKRRRDLDDLDGKSTRTAASRAQTVLDVTDRIKVTLDHFYGIEVEEWPARIAETAMLLVDHLANQAMEEEFGLAPDRLPIRIAPTIKHGNALRTDWAALLPPSDDVIIMGNPPFSGRGDRSAAQTIDEKFVWGLRYNINLDYVTCWYLRAVEYFGRHAGRWAFVSTNSTCQGEPVATLWRPILDAGWRCRFAHRSFKWDSEAQGQAAVHVSIVGFDQDKTPKPVLWTYPEGGQGHGTPAVAPRINPYLIDGPSILVDKRSNPLSTQMPKASFGSMPNDGGHLLVEADEYDTVTADPIAKKYLRRFVGAKELIHNKERWCLWLVDLDERDLRKSKLLRQRVEAVRHHRSSSASPTTSTKNHPPHLFGQIAQPKTSYLAIPAHVSEHRRFYPAARYEPNVICGNANFLMPDPDGFALAIVSSSMFMVWQKTIGGRIKSDLRFSKTFTYNTFPLPLLSKKQYTGMCSAANGILAARTTHVGWSLAQIYESGAIPENVVAAHLALDDVLDSAFGRANLDTEAGRQKTLFRAYATKTGQETLLTV